MVNYAKYTKHIMELLMLPESSQDIAYHHIFQQESFTALIPWPVGIFYEKIKTFNIFLALPLLRIFGTLYPSPSTDIFL